MTTTGERLDTAAGGPGLDRSDIPRPLPSRPLWAVGGSILLLLTIGWGTYDVVELIAHETRSESYAVDASGLSELVVHNDAGRVTITGTDGGEIHVEAEISRGMRDTDVSHGVTSSVLEVRGNCPLLGSIWCSVAYRIEVPRHLDVRVSADNDRVSVSGMDGDVVVDTDNGRTELSEIGGSIDVDGDNGSIVGVDLSGPVARASTDNGRIELSFTSAPDEVVATGDNGGIEIVVPGVEGGYDVRSNTDNGSIEIDVVNNPASPRLIDVETDNGSIDVRNSRS